MTTASPILSPIDGRWRRWTITTLVALTTVTLFLVGYWPRHAAHKKLAAETTAAEHRAPRVKVMSAVASDSARTLTLPGTLVAYEQALVNARATGYVRRWRVDIGDRVHSGEVLAELDTPDLDQQLAQARATLVLKKAAVEQAVANLDYAQTTAARTHALFGEGLVSKQTTDQADAQEKVGVANLHAAYADEAAAGAAVNQLVQLVAFGNVTAPFDGRITQRNIDVGSLVIAGSAVGAAPLFRIEATDPMRVFVQVPQPFATSIKDDEPSTVSVRQLPNRTFQGHVTRTSGTFDPTSRTLTVEVDVPNARGELLGGMFAQVTVAAAVAHRVVPVPAGAVISDARGDHVATVDGAGRVRLAAVTRGLDHGGDVDIVDGLVGGERFIVNPGGDVTDGMQVQPVGQ
jgi:RND family efflux transporter MFP subunit